MTSFLYRAPSGVAGDVTRPDDTVVEPGLLNAAQAPTAFGAPVKLVSGKFEKIAASDAAAVFAGILSRIAPSIAGDTAQTFAGGTPNTDSVQGIVVEGYVNVVCTIGTPVRGDTVYMRVVAASGKAVGDLEAISDIATTGAAGAGNVGNGTIGALSATQSAQVGVYVATMTGATTFQVVAPDGNQLKAGATGAAYTAGGVTFTITVGATAMAAGDKFTVTVTKNNVALTGVTWAIDGRDSSNIAEILIK